MGYALCHDKGRGPGGLEVKTAGNTVYIKHFTGKVQPATHTTFKRSGL